MTIQSYGAVDPPLAPDSQTTRIDDDTTHQRPWLLWALVVGGLALHNVEEGLFGLTRWMAGHPWLPGRVLHGDGAQFAIALVLVTTVVLLVAVVAVTTRARWGVGALASIAYAFLINGGSHVVLSVTSWSLMPGTVSGALVLVPIGLLTLRSLPSVPWSRASVVATVGAALGLVVGSLVLAAALAPVLGVR
ncbi:HXXEE domain-containing protein [Ornithinimicrobium faecis]|uniref:HXXEE domain-containing protein n=1 Tax=Ornithinimicrobium faecis TaxID=2934158 RepID=A0ABY4YUE6_9MICO|nr:MULTISPECIES: HXXEE domain-containing protein [unclassified Ornithinimicrobium]USQ80207.1 HXXEE domain-containing protein [Ornithinimicrobium sp. HY1793]